VNPDFQQSNLGSIPLQREVEFQVSPLITSKMKTLKIQNQNLRNDAGVLSNVQSRSETFFRSMRIFYFLMFLLLVSGRITAQPNPALSPEQMVQQAETFQQRGDHARADALYDSAAQAYSDAGNNGKAHQTKRKSGNMWREAGERAARERDYAAAATSFRNAEQDYSQAMPFAEDPIAGAGDIESAKRAEANALNNEGKDLVMRGIDARDSGNADAAKELFEQAADRFDRANQPRNARNARRLAEQVSLVPDGSLPDLFRDKMVSVRPLGTGNTTGRISDLLITNLTDQPLTATLGSAFIPATGQYQSYIVSETADIEIPAKGSITHPVNGYCADIFSPAVPSGKPMSGFESWIFLEDDMTLFSEDGSGRPLGIGWEVAELADETPWATTSIPGTDTPLGFTIDIRQNPATAAPFLLTALNGITDGYDRLVAEGSIHTPFSGDPEKERESVIQQTFWMYSAALEGRPYKISDFETNVMSQFEEATGTDIEDASEETVKSLQDGVLQFWTTFQSVGEEAKVLNAKRLVCYYCYLKKDCRGGRIGQVNTKADCEAVGGKSVRPVYKEEGSDWPEFGECENL
jgi:tetratricopeptide (TPR) repeat protein